MRDATDVTHFAGGAFWVALMKIARASFPLVV